MLKSNFYEKIGKKYLLKHKYLSNRTFLVKFIVLFMLKFTDFNQKLFLRKNRQKYFLRHKHPMSKIFISYKSFNFYVLEKKSWQNLIWTLDIYTWVKVFCPYFHKNSFWRKPFNLNRKALGTFFVENFMSINYYINEILPKMFRYWDNYA